MQIRINTLIQLNALLISIVFVTSCTPAWERGARNYKQSVSEITNLPPRSQIGSNDDTVGGSIKQLPAHIKSLDDLVDWGLRNNPRISARMSAVYAMESTINQSSALPDPVLKIAPFGEMTQTAAGQVEYSIGLEQRFPAPGQLSSQAGMAYANTKMASSDYIKEQINTAYKIRVSWHTFIWAQLSENIISKQIQLLEQLHAVILTRVEAQQAAQSDAVRLQVVLDELKAKKRSWIERKNNAQTSLLTQLHMDHSASIRSFEDTGTIPTVSLNDLFLLAQSTRPDFLRNDAAIQHAAAKTLLAQSKSRPSFSTFLNYTAIDDNGLSPMANGDDNWSIGFSVSLPVWRSVYRSAESEAVYLSEKAIYERMSIADYTKNEISNALESLTSVEEQLQILKQDILGGAKQALELETASYEAGKGTYQDLIQSWRRLFATELQEAFLNKMHSIALADVLKSLGLTTFKQIDYHLLMIRQKRESEH